MDFSAFRSFSSTQFRSRFDLARFAAIELVAKGTFFSLVALHLALGAGCDTIDEATQYATSPIGMWQAPIVAYCEANVVGVGNVDVENDYVASVVSCENGAADFEALKAQAVSARTYLYFKMETSGSIANGTGDQVYSCGRPPNETHREAARLTAGQVLRYQDTTLAGFYVAGAIPTTDTCVPAPDDRDATNTERYVTYNWGRSGDQVTQTTLGWVNPANLRNRGCKSQNGANCLSRAGWDYVEILQFYYGMDVVFETAVGPCVPDPEPDPEPDPIAEPEPQPYLPQLNCNLLIPEAAIELDSEGPCFGLECEGGGVWGTLSVPEGSVGGSVIAVGTSKTPEPMCRGRWELRFARDGIYQLSVHIPQWEGAKSRYAQYRIRHRNGEYARILDQNRLSGWQVLGAFSFEAGQSYWVDLSSDTQGMDGEEGRWLLMDAVGLLKVGDIDGGDEPDTGVDEWGDTGGNGPEDLWNGDWDSDSPASNEEDAWLGCSVLPGRLVAGQQSRPLPLLALMAFAALSVWKHRKVLS